MLAIAFLLWHFSQAAGLAQYLDVLRHRPGGHAVHGRTVIWSIVALGPIYLPMVALAASLWLRPARATAEGPATPPRRLQDVVWPVTFCALGAAVESVVLLQHTVWYTYGSLPLTLFLILLLLVVFVRTGANIRHLAVGTAACVAVWMLVYFEQNPVSLAQSPFGRQFADLDAVSRIAAPDERVFTNLKTPLGVPLARAKRNLVASPAISPDTPLPQMHAILRQDPRVPRGKVFIFDLMPRTIAQRLWWPYTKSRVLDHPKQKYGPLAGVVSFDTRRVTAVQVRKDRRSREVILSWLRRQGLVPGNAGLPLP